MIRIGVQKTDVFLLERLSPAAGSAVSRKAPNIGGTDSGRHCGAPFFNKVVNHGEVSEMRNKKGFVPVVFIAGAALVTAITARGVVETAQNGTLKKNGQTIWCKMQGNSADYCDAKR